MRGEGGALKEGSRENHGEKNARREIVAYGGGKLEAIGRVRLGDCRRESQGQAMKH